MTATSNTTLAATVPIIYKGCVGSPAPDGSAYLFEMPEQAPRSLCDRPPSREPDPNPDATGYFVTTLIERHNAEFLFSRAWRCQVCEEPARELYHSAIARLHPGEGVQPEYVPFVWDTIVPICRSGGSCDRQAGEWALALGKEGMPTLDVGAKSCEVCGKVTGVKVCRGCKVLV